MAELTNMRKTIELGGLEYMLDGQGFLLKRMTWSEDLGERMAELDGLSLTAEHWEIIHYFREYYETYNIPPPVRMVVRVFKQAFGEQNANSRYLHQLFPAGLSRTASKYGGLPKPKNCN